MKPKLFSLKSYAALTAAFLASEKLSSQIIFQDFDPDLRLMNWTGDYIEDDSILIDIDDNGIYDLLFYYETNAGDASLDVKIQDAVTAIYADEAGYILPLESDGIVWPYMFNWKTGTNNLRNIYISTYSGSYTEWCNSSPGGNTYINDYIPIKLSLDGSLHYGWIRLSTPTLSSGGCNFNNIGSPLVIYDIAWNDTPGGFINCEANVSPEIVFGVSDINDADTFSEFSFGFNYEDIHDLNELRFYIIPNRNECISFSVEQALTLNENRYLKLIPDDIDTDVNSNFSPNSDMLDINGDPFQQDHYYSAIMLSIPTDTTLMRSNLSVPVKVFKAIDNTCFLGDAFVEIKAILHDETGYSCSMTLFADEDESDISIYKFGFYDHCDISEIYDRMNEFDLENLPSVLITGQSVYQCNFNSITKDIFGDLIVPGTAYYPVLIGIGDGEQRDKNCFTVDCENPVCFPTRYSPVLNNSLFSIVFEDGILTINALSESLENIKFSLISVNGEQVVSELINEHVSRFNLDNLATGLYVATIYNNDLISAMKLIVR